MPAVEMRMVVQIYIYIVANIPSDIQVLEIGIQGILQRFHRCSSACVSIQQHNVYFGLRKLCLPKTHLEALFLLLLGRTARTRAEI